MQGELENVEWKTRVSESNRIHVSQFHSQIRKLHENKINITVFDEHKNFISF